MIVVADTTPLLYLSRIGRLDMARALYVEVLVPHEVHEELVEKPDADGVNELRAAEWFVVEAPTSIAVDESVLTAFDAGEAAALRLTFERRALVLIDERAGRGRCTPSTLRSGGRWERSSRPAFEGSSTPLLRF